MVVTAAASGERAAVILSFCEAGSGRCGARSASLCARVPRVDKLQEEQGRRAAAEASAAQLKRECAELHMRAQLLEQQVRSFLHACVQKVNTLWQCPVTPGR